MRKAVLLAAALGSTMLATPALAAMDEEKLLARLEQLEAELKSLKAEHARMKQEAALREEREQKALAALQPAAGGGDSAKVEMGKKGLSVTSPDGAYAVAVHGLAQIDSRAFFDDESNSQRNDILARRLRPTLDAKVAKDFTMKLTPDFGGSSPKVVDAHIDYTASKAASLRIGKFKPPLGLEHLQSDPDVMFAERGHPANFSPARDFGVQLYGEAVPGVLEYQIGVFGGAFDGDTPTGDNDDKKDLAARVFAHPFKNSGNKAAEKFGLGVGGSIGEREGSAANAILPSYRTTGQQTFFRYASGAFADGTQWRVFPQAYWYNGAFGVVAEYALSMQEVATATSSERLGHRAWQVAASYVLTGENARYKGSVVPDAPLNPAAGQWGAWEIAARVGETDIDNDAFPLFASAASSASEARSAGLGLNWYPNENIRLVVDYEQTRFDGGAPGGADRPDEKVLISRAQYRF